VTGPKRNGSQQKDAKLNSSKRPQRKPRRETFKPVEAIEVRIWNQRVGALARDPRLGFYAFEYDPKFAAQGIELAPLQMPTSISEPFIFPGLSLETFQRLPAMIADALPDKFGNALITAWMQQRGVNVSSITELDRLAYMGKRGFGALEFHPMRSPVTESSTAIKLAKLVESARLAVHGDLETDQHSENALSEIIRVGTSAGGARAKAAIAWNPNTQEVRAGQFDVTEGFQHWLLKFDGLGKDAGLGATRDFGRVEYAYHLMAVQAGIEMSECQVLEENGRAHFMTRRFDRDGNNKHHLQTLCAMAHLDFNQIGVHDYAQYFQTIQRLNLGYEALEQAYRRMAFNVMAANCDDHSKNFSFILRQGQAWALAPAYDLTFAFDPANKWTRQHLMGVNGKFASVTMEDMLAVAERFAIGRAPRVLREVRQAVAVWPEFASQARVSSDEIKHVGSSHVLL
jgi:serine/threonine-protein kinase HipA